MKSISNLKLKLSGVVLAVGALIIAAAPIIPANAQAATAAPQTATITITQDQVNALFADPKLKAISNVSITLGTDLITANFTVPNKKGTAKQVSETFAVSGTFPLPVLNAKPYFALKSLTVDGAAPKNTASDRFSHVSKLHRLIRQQIVKQLKSLDARVKGATITAVVIQTGAIVVTVQYTPRPTPVATPAATATAS